MGDIVVLSDHINLPGLAGQNPLIGENEGDFGERFTALSDAYDLTLRRALYLAASEMGLARSLHEGTYCFVSGPFYETRGKSVLVAFDISPKPF